MDATLNQEEFEAYSESVQKTNTVAQKLWGILNPSKKLPADAVMYGIMEERSISLAWDLACAAVYWHTDGQEDPESWVDLLNDHLNGQVDPCQAYKASLGY